MWNYFFNGFKYFYYSLQDWPECFVCVGKDAKCGLDTWASRDERNKISRPVIGQFLPFLVFHWMKLNVKLSPSWSQCLRCGPRGQKGRGNPDPHCSPWSHPNQFDFSPTFPATLKRFGNTNTISKIQNNKVELEIARPCEYIKVLGRNWLVCPRIENTLIHPFQFQYLAFH